MKVAIIGAGNVGEAMLWIQLALKHHDRDFAFVVARRDAANRRAEPRVRVVHSPPQEVE